MAKGKAGTRPLESGSSASGLHEILERMRAIALSAEKRSGQPAPRVDPATIRHLHAQAYASAKQEKASNANTFQSRQTFCGDIYCSRRMLSELQPVLIKDLRMEQMHKGKYLLCRIVEPCFKMSGIMALVEDRLGGLTILSLYNFVASESVDVEELLPVGTVLAVKEPYYKFSNTNTCVIRVDSPSDVVLLERSGPNNGLGEESIEAAAKLLDGVQWSRSLTMTAKPNLATASLDELKDLQIEACQNSRFNDVADISTRLLKLCQGDVGPFGQCHSVHEAAMQAIVPLRGFALFETGRFEVAFRDLKWVLESNPLDASSLNVAGQTLVALRKWREAEKVFHALSQLPAKIPQDVPRRAAWLGSVRARLSEAEEGRYDLGQMMSGGAKRLNNADYIGPVRLEPKGGAYKMVATASVPPGTLLFAVKALEIVYASELADAASGFTMINFKNSIISRPAKSQLVTQLAQRILANPSMAAGLYDLPLDGYSGPRSLYADDARQREAVTDIDLLHRIVAQHAATPVNLDDSLLNRGQPQQNENGEEDAGIWVLPSHVAHACCSSAVATYIGDFMLIRAKQHLKPGDEITIPRIESVTTLEIRSSELASRGVSCYCDLCETERAESRALVKRRAQLISDFTSKFRLGQPDDLEVLSRIIKGLEDTYVGSPLPIKQMLYLPYTALGAVHLSRDERALAARAFESALRALGFTQAHEDYLLHGKGTFPRSILLPLAPMTAIHVYNYYWHAGELALAERWYRIARDLDKTLHGGDEALFQRLYRSFIEVA